MGKYVSTGTTFFQHCEDGGSNIVGILVVGELVNTVTVFEDGLPVVFSGQFDLLQKSLG